MDLGISGLASGFDWRSFVDQMMEVERAPQQRLRTEQNHIQERNNAFTSIKTQLSTLSARVIALKDVNLYSARTVTVADATLANATATAGAP